MPVKIVLFLEAISRQVLIGVLVGI